MTKKMRIENADNSDHPVVVQVWDRGQQSGQRDKMVEERPLNHPTDLTEILIWSGRYLVVKERDE